ncbi:nuclear transport factor 2 family protein [Desulfosediminicola flagellatus]|uniref:nuclear transport factor 2 family protein n=1 Tax=Desulfosediminicola flagellatus TaxID=2569541 RepID=UPI0010AB8DAF|nr:nuclear transport factor 2 family protein [Desulfosediminicola flagellatus]
MDAFLETYKKLNAQHLNLLDDIYSSEIHFIDPVHELRGLTQLHKYFENLYANIHHIQFEFSHPQWMEKEGYVQWLMTFAHPRIHAGQRVTVPGTSFLKFDSANKVYFHRDYFDIGAMLYQHLPIIGPVVKMINRRLAQ